MKNGKMPNRIRTLDDVRGRCNLTESGCWLWLGGVAKNGSPRMSYCDKVSEGARVPWLLAGRSVPEGKVLYRVIDKCRERLCINPDHFACGTYAEVGESRRGKLIASGSAAPGSQRSSVLRVLASFQKPQGLTRDEVASFSGLDRESVGACIGHMRRAGRVFELGSGEKARVFATAAERDAAAARKAEYPVVTIKAAKTPAQFKAQVAIDNGVKITRLPGFTGDRFAVHGPVIGGFKTMGIGRYLEAA